jgi:hypothetical protein
LRASVVNGKNQSKKDEKWEPKPVQTQHIFLPRRAAAFTNTFVLLDGTTFSPACVSLSSEKYRFSRISLLREPVF